LNHFLFDSRKGIKTQLWIAMILNLIFTVIHKIIKEAEDFSTLVKLAAKNTVAYVSFMAFLQKITGLREDNQTHNPKNIQLSLFDQNKEDP